MQIFLGFKYELYLTPFLRAALSRNAGCRRFVFNKALELQNERRKAGLKPLTYAELCRELIRWKMAEETAFLKEAIAQSLQQGLRDLSRAVRDTFRPKGDPARKEWPRFKAKDIGDGFRIPQFKTSDIDDANGRVKLPKIGWVRYKKTRPMAFRNADGSFTEGVVREIHINKDCGRWFVAFTVEFDIEPPQMKPAAIGIDIGVVHAVALSDGRFFDLNTDKLKEIEAQIAVLKRKLSLNRSSRMKLAEKGLAEPFDKNKPSCQRRRLKQKIQKLYRRMRCIRRDFYRKTAHTLAHEYGCVYAEDLKTKNMTKSAKGTVDNPGKKVKQKSGLNRAILRTGFYSLLLEIMWQLEKAGGILIKVNPAYTSCLCPICGCCDKRNRPKQALFHCIACGHEQNADTVGAVNVYEKGRTGPSAHDKKSA